MVDVIIEKNGQRFSGAADKVDEMLARGFTVVT